MESRAALLVAARMVYLGVPLVARQVVNFNEASWRFPVFYRFLSPKLPRLWRVLWDTKSCRPHGFQGTLEPFASTVWGAGNVMRKAISEF